MTAACRPRVCPVNSRAAWLVAGALGIAGVGSACSRTPTGFDGLRARAHLEMLAATIGSRPVGTPANRRARDYLVEQLTASGFAVRIQDAIAVNPQFGVTAPVSNIIAVRDGARREAIALVSHYDSVPEASGAIDNGIGVATSLEAARVLAASPMTASLFVLITDGEEIGLMGARALVRDAEVAGRLRAFLNFDNTGASGPSLLYETAAASAVVHAWAAAAPAPAGASFATEIYKRLPNDTDFTILKTTGAAGLNFAVVGDAYAYHTDRDVAARVPTSTLQRGGDNTVGIVRDLDARMTVATAGVPAAGATYFDVAGTRGVVYSARTATILTSLACLAGLAGWLRLTRDLWRASGFGGVVRTLAWAVVAGAGVLGAQLGAALTMRLLRAETNYWYATPVWSYAWIAAAGVGAVAAVGRLSAIAPPHLSPWRGPAAVWWVALPIWLALTTALEVSAPVAAYVFALPLLVASIAVLVTGGRASALRVASALVAVVVLAISASKVLLLMKFVVPLFGWLPVAAPLWLQPALVLVAFVTGGPPILALIGGGALSVTQRRALAATLGLALAATGVMTYVAGAYTADRPERRIARYVQDDRQRQAWLDVGGPEPALALGPGSVPPSAWASGRTRLPASVRLAPLETVFAHRAAVPSADRPRPADVRSTLGVPSDPFLEILITPREYIGAQIVLPAGIVPATTSLAGRLVDGRWTATFIGVPESGLTVRLGFDSGATAAQAMTGGAVMLTSRGLPGGSGPLGQPDWLPRAQATWRARSIWIMPLR